MNPLRAARDWLAAPVPQTERVHYRLGHADPDDGWQRPRRTEVWRRSLARRIPSPEKWLYSAGLRRADGLTLPDVLCIGAQKAATSWLHANLARHPGAFVPPDVKEVHYFDFLFHEPLRDYAAVFAAGAGRVKCDVTPNYGRLRPARIRFVRRVMPEARLVLLLRHPVERAWSQAVMDLATRCGRRVDQVPREEWLAHFRAPANRRNGAYTAIADRWLRHFPRERLLVGFAEEAAAQPRELLARVFRHVGLAADAEWPDLPAEERIAAGPGVPLPEALRAELAPLFAAEVRRCAERFGGPARDWPVD